MVNDPNKKREIIMSPDFLKKYMVPDSVSNEHAVRNHVGLNLPQLINRKLQNEIEGTPKPATSSFETYEQYQKIIQQALIRNQLPNSKLMGL